MKKYQWPGNTRQLINALEYGAITCKGDAIDIHDLPDYLNAKSGRKLANADNLQKERQMVLEALEKNRYNRTHTAKDLNISRVALWKKMKRLDIHV